MRPQAVLSQGAGLHLLLACNIGSRLFSNGVAAFKHPDHPSGSRELTKGAAAHHVQRQVPQHAVDLDGLPAVCAGSQALDQDVRALVHEVRVAVLPPAGAVRTWRLLPAAWWPR